MKQLPLSHLMSFVFLCRPRDLLETEAGLAMDELPRGGSPFTCKALDRAVVEATEMTNAQREPHAV